MPAIKKPSKFPGIESLPGPIRGLAEFMFPQEPDLPTPVGMAPAVAKPFGKARPAIAALLRTLRQRLPEPDPATVLAGSKMGGVLKKEVEIAAPKGFTFGGGYDRRLPAKRTPYINARLKELTKFRQANPAWRKDPRFTPEDVVGDVTRQEVAPTVTSLDELGSLPRIAPETKTPILSAARRSPHNKPWTKTLKEGRKGIKDLTPDTIEQVQRAAGTGRNAQELSDIFGINVNLVTKVLKMPWRWSK